MLRGVVNLVLGLVMLGGAATGQLALRGTDSSWGVGLLGAVVTGLGLYRIYSARQATRS